MCLIKRAGFKENLREKGQLKGEEGTDREKEGVGEPLDGLAVKEGGGPQKDWGLQGEQM